MCDWFLLYYVISLLYVIILLLVVIHKFRYYNFKILHEYEITIATVSIYNCYYYYRCVLGFFPTLRPFLFRGTPSIVPSYAIDDNIQIVSLL